MQNYADTNNDSGISSYEINPTSIKVWFNRNAFSYTYSYSSASEYHVEHMKALAIAGNGLNHYIDKHVKKDYER